MKSDDEDTSMKHNEKQVFGIIDESKDSDSEVQTVDEFTVF